MNAKTLNKKLSFSFLFLLLAVSSTAVLGGCGGDDEATASLSKAEFVKQAGDICTEERRKAVKVAAENRPKKKSAFELVPGTLKESIEKALGPALESDIERIEALGVPEGDDEQVKVLLDSMQAAVDTIQAGDTTQVVKALESSDQQAASYGVRACMVVGG